MNTAEAINMPQVGKYFFQPNPYAPVHAPKPRTLKAWKKLKSKQRSAAKLARIAETL
jgi:hypothetical protein